MVSNILKSNQKMDEYDIDIVEHDLLDNPLVRKMFPDLTILKKDTMDFDSEVPVENTHKTYNNVIEQEIMDNQIIEEETNDHALSFPRIPAHKVYSRIHVGKKILKELHKEQISTKNTLCNEVITRSYIIDDKTNEIDSIRNQHNVFNVSELSSLVIEKELSKTTNICEQNIIADDIHCPTLVELLNKPSGVPKYKSNLYPRKISQESGLQKEYSNNTIGSICSENSKNFCVENSQLNQQQKVQQMTGPKRSSCLNLKGNKIIIGSKQSVTHGDKKMSKDVKVSLENLSTFLRKSTRYCKICCRLFPSNKTLTDHQNLVHIQTGDSQSSELVMDVSIKQNNTYDCTIIDGTVTSSSTSLVKYKNTGDKINVHVFQHNIQSQAEDQLNTESETIKCNHCNNWFETQQLLIDHMYNIIQTNSKNILKPAKIKERERGYQDEDDSTGFFYQCSFCACYFKLRHMYINHMKVKHRKKSNLNLTKVAFDPTCKICSHTYCNLISFNTHVRNYHLKHIMPRNKFKLPIVTAEKSKNNEPMIKIKENKLKTILNTTEININKKESHAKIIDCQVGNPNRQYLLKSALFKCFKCDIWFLSATKAAYHVDHMDTLNWKCLKCLKIFKKEDESLHTQQHLFTDTFHLYETRDIAQLAVLYKCPNCTTYFLEKDFFSHYSVCETQSPVSAYCKICHNLIDDKIKDLHDKHHLSGNKELKILFVESDVITYNDDLDVPKLDEGRKGVQKIPSFTYCTTCRCFVRRIQNLYYHTKGRCVDITKYVCRLCGLILSHKSFNHHRKLHKNVPGLTLHDFKFYDFHSGKIMRPPVPKYPNCHKCGKHFITKTAVISHQCNEAYLTCPVCKIKLSNAAFPLHASFHNYLPRKEISDTLNNTTALDLLPKPKVHPSEVVTVSINSLVDSNLNNKTNHLVVYVCKSCNIALDVYDRVIEHCQDHISRQEAEIKTKACDTCNITFDVSCFDNHIMLHACNRNKKFVILSFDAFYATGELNIWLNHLFGSLPKESIEKIVEISIYKFERRVKMKIVQEGLKNLTFYKCAKCKKYIDSMSLYKHCQMGILCFKSKTLQCSLCGLQFVSEDYLNEHTKIHERQDITISSYRIVLFNCDEHKSINHALSLPNQYILYECRNCNGILNTMDIKNHQCDYDDLSKCPHCGLLIFSSDYMAHIIKHIEFCSFTESNMRIILIGQLKNGSELNRNLVPSFKGIRLDYLMYQCNRCLVCVKDKESSIRHNCIMDTAPTKCLLCELYFDDSQIKNHRAFHERNSYFIKENITVVKFGLTNPLPFGEDVIVIEDDEDLESIPNNILGHKKVNKTIGECQSEVLLEKNDDIFKCKCGLHFLNKQMALSHCQTCVNFSFIKQMCSKCGLVFMPSVLYSHLLLHHGTKNTSYKLNIIEVS